METDRGYMSGYQTVKGNNQLYNFNIARGRFHRQSRYPEKVKKSKNGEGNITKLLIVVAKSLKGPRGALMKT